MRYGIRSALIMITVAMLLGSGPALAASTACKADLNGDLVVNFADLAVLKSVFFQRCGQSGPTCGDNVAQGPTEQCDDGNVLNGDGCSATCTLEPAFHFPATGQTTCWDSGGNTIACPRTVPLCLLTQCAGSGQDGNLQRGAALAYVDNGDGTITDGNTGLMWEKLSYDKTIHDWNNLYTWDGAFALKIATLNGSGRGFAGHADWRVPNIKELKSIVNYGAGSPALSYGDLGSAVSAAFSTGCTTGCTVTSCSCTAHIFDLALDSYWSSSSYALTPTDAWLVSFDFGDGKPAVKTFGHYVRAVRGGP